MSAESTRNNLTAALRRYFGFGAFREGQEEIVRRAVEGRDTLAIMPTGAGKSLCYQLAAMLRDTPTLVLSPLIALMKDQIDNLPPEVATQASLINSSLEPGEAANRLRALATGRYKLIYAAPERLRQRQFVAALRSVGIGLAVIDEVHCVSMWGHDFRPDYLFIRPALAALGDPVVLGLTATATPATAADVATSLGRRLDVVRASVVRPNLRYEVQSVDDEEQRQRATLAYVAAHDGSGIIYARARDRCEKVARLLQQQGVRAAHYHARLEPSDRSRVQEQFIRGNSRVIVATTAFGMGIDKPDIRWVLLYNYPKSLEEYVQMVGRAGRDGELSACTLLDSGADAKSLRRFALASVPPIDQLRVVYRRLQACARAQSDDGRMAEIAADELSAACDLKEDDDVRVLVGMLERAGLARRDFDAGRAMRIELPPPPADSSNRITALLDAYADQALERAERMVDFAEANRCRHRQVAEHFGDSVRTPCGMCDVCSPAPGSAAAPAPESRPLPANLGQSILDAVKGLGWPLGYTGLVTMLQGSISAPPSAQRNKAYGVLSAARPYKIKQWVDQLIESGHLQPYESDDGFKLLRVGKTANLPELAAPVLSRAAKKDRRATRDGAAEDAGVDADAVLTGEAAALFERLREWRREQARQSAVPAYVVMHDRALREIAITRPRTQRELARIEGIGPAKLERWGEQIIALVREG